MPPKKDEQESRTITKEAVAEPGSAAGLAEKAAARERAAAAGRRSAGPTITSRQLQLMLFARGAAGLQPLAGPEFLEQSLRNHPDIEILDVLTSRNPLDVFGGMPGSHKVMVARMDAQKASLFASQAGHQIAIERDHLLTYGQGPSLLLWIDPAALQQALAFTATFKVTANDTPVEGAEVGVVGISSLTQGVTDRQGELQLDVSGELPSTIRALFVNPPADCWTMWIPEPAINLSGDNVVALTPLSSTFPGFPRQQLVGWGNRVMRFEQLPPSYRGKGIKIGIIDSGVAAGHSALRGQVKSGYDTIMKSKQGWDQDAIGHGTHCAGIICGRSPSGSGIQGVAAEAEVIACKVSPGGAYSNLLEAIDFCIAQQVDVMQISVTGPEPSQIVEQKLLQAKELGIACIAAAGDSGGSVQYPASSANVLAVSAIGKQGEFPTQSYHALSVTGFTTPAGLYSPGFSCSGPQVGVCAPGVAVVSSVPPDNFAPQDGTATAAAYVTGLAGLVLAHHPEFQPQGVFSARNAFRVERLFQLIQQNAQPINVGGVLRVGAGLPDAALATMAAAVRPDLTSLLSQGVQYPGLFRPMAFSPGNLSLAAATQAPRQNGSPMNGGWPIPQAGPLLPGQESMSSLLMAIQQIRAMMQSAGIL